MGLANLATTLFRPASEAAALGVRAERRARQAVTGAAGDAALGLLDAMLASPVAEQAVDRVLDSPLVERGLSRALEGTLVEAAARDLARYAVIERAGEQLFAGEEVERIVISALESPEAERLVARVIDSRLVDEAVARLLESKDLWLLVDEIARSPSVTQAISHQSVGFAEEVVGAVRRRSHTADDRAERIARRLLRREAADGDK